MNEIYDACKLANIDQEINEFKNKYETIVGNRGENISGGQRNFIPYLVRAAAANGIQALFMEVHDNVNDARSDASTQWPLDELESVLISLKRIRDTVL